MALQGWDKNYREELKIQQEVIESLQQQLMIVGGGREPNEEDAPYRPAPIPNPGQPPWPGYPNPRLAGGPQLPNFKPMGRVIEGTRKGVLPMNETKITRPLQIGPQAMNYPPPSELDKWLQLYQRNGGSLRHLDPDMRRLILQRGVMKAEAANNIRSLQSSGHQTVLDDNRPGHLKIIKQFRPPRA